MPTTPRHNHWIFTALLLLLPLLITYDAVLRDHTISYLFTVGGNSTRGINALPLLDPSAGSHQDEPWTYLIGTSWAKGEIPLINQANGLGAPLLASLQSGALYPGNLLLMVLPKSSAQFFDWFSVAHVVLLAFGLFLLACRFTAESWVSALIAGSLAASLATVYEVNMVHFRAFAWAPWMAVGLIDVIRHPGLNRGAIGLFLLACFCSFSAGNPQQSVLDLGATIMVAVVCMHKDGLWFRWRLLASVVGIGLLIASVTILPYFAGVASNDLRSVADVTRSRLSLADRLTMLLDMIVPRGTGYAGALWQNGSGFYELQFAWPVVWLLGLFGWVAAGARQRSLLKWTWPLAFMLSLFIAKVAGIGPWDWISSIPLINGIRFTKYTLSTVLILLPLVVVGIDFIQIRCLEHPSIAMSFGLVIFFVFAFAFAAYLLDFQWQPNLKNNETRLAVAMALVSMVAAVTLPLLLTQRHRKVLVLLWTLGLALALRPAGFQQELSYESMRNYTAPTQLVAANLSDQNWENGVHRGKPGFFVNDPTSLRYLAVGDSIKLPSGQVRKIQRLSGDQVWLDGTEPLSPVADGFPHVIALDLDVSQRAQVLAQMMMSPWPRVADAGLTPNANLIVGHASPWVFDPVMNRRYRDLVTTEFATFNPGFDTQPTAPYPLTLSQVDVMRMMGVGLILGHPLPENPYYKAMGHNIYRIDRGLLPEAVVIPEALVPVLEGLFMQKRYGAFVDRVLSEGRACVVERPGPNELTVMVPPGSGQRRVLLNRVFMEGWNSASGVVPLADFWLATVVSGGGERLALWYWPPGLTLGLLLAGAGLAGLVFLVLFYRRRKEFKEMAACPG